MSNTVQGLMDTTMEKIRAMVDVNTIIGDQIVVESGLTLIPVSKVTLGFASGGSDFPTKHEVMGFGGGGGAGITIVPVAFIAVNGTDAKIININPSAGAADKAIALVPEVFDRICSLIKKEKKEQPKEEKKDIAGKDGTAQ